MERRGFFIGIILLTIGTLQMESQTTAKLALDDTKPIVYVKFDHAGPRQPVQEGEPSKGLWLRLVNNSAIPIVVRANGSATDEAMTLLQDVVTAKGGRIPKSGPVREKMTTGYVSDTGSILIVDPGKDLIFSIPRNHVSPNWYMQVPFQFSLRPVKEGVQPICYAEFTWEDLPETYRTGEH